MNTKEIDAKNKQIEELIAENAELKKKVESMKCPGNCARMSDIDDPCVGHWRWSDKCPCEHWILKERP